MPEFLLRNLVCKQYDDRIKSRLIYEKEILWQIYARGKN